MTSPTHARRHSCFLASDSHCFPSSITAFYLLSSRFLIDSLTNAPPTNDVFSMNVRNWEDVKPVLISAARSPHLTSPLFGRRSVIE